MKVKEVVKKCSTMPKCVGCDMKVHCERLRAEKDIEVIDLIDAYRELEKEF